MKLIDTFLTLVLGLAISCHAFNVNKAVRHHHTDKVGEYTATDRAWRFPDKSKIRSTDDLNSALQADERIWRYPTDAEKKIRRSNKLDIGGNFMKPEDRAWRKPNKKQIITDPSAPRQAYTDLDRMEWAAPDPSQLRHSNEVPAFGPEDRLWRHHRP